MGVWGEGMQANDSAWDAIGAAGFDVNKKAPTRTLKALRAKPEAIRKYFRKLGDPLKILGLAEYFLDSGADLGPVLKLVLDTIKAELSPKALGCWCDLESRKGALRRFRDRLRGKAVDHKKVAADNEGLLSKMSRLG